MAKRKINREIRNIVLDITSKAGYNACSPAELLDMVAGKYGDGAGAVSFTEEFFDTLDEMRDAKEIGYSGKGNVLGICDLGYLEGIFRANSKGFGFLTPAERFSEKYPEDLFIGAEDTLGAMNGDTVLVRIRESGKNNRRQESGSAEASVIRILTHANQSVIGTLCADTLYRGRKQPIQTYYVTADNRKITTHICIAEKDIGDAHIGDKVEAEICKYPNVNNPDAYAKVVRVFGETHSKAANYAVILRENDIRTELPDAVYKEAETEAGRAVLPEGRLDLRDKMIFTIDGADSKDLDDAISLEKTENGYLLGVHIADVSEYVRENTELDKEAFLRGTSVYFADQVIPMLPKSLSNGICSLNPGEDRYALSALISLDEAGKLCGCTLAESVIRSKIRGVYEELNAVLEKGAEAEAYAKYAALFPDIYPMMVSLYRILEEKNRKKGALDLETEEPKFILDENGFPIAIEKRKRGISECLIEQFMLCANEAVAMWLSERNMPCVYRIHEEPPSEKVQGFAAFAYHLGLDIRPLRRKTLTPADMQSVMNEAKEKGLSSVLSTVMLRSLSKARYSREHGVHFGLATDYYCHFTSPIRRYPDLTVHRFVKNVLHGKTDDRSVAEMYAFAARSADQSSECELHAMTAERSIDDLYSVLYMQDKVGEEFDGTISSVTSFGFFVTLDNTCEGLVPITSLNGYFSYDEKTYTLSCGRTVYCLGQKVRVRLTRADIVTRKLDMELTDTEITEKTQALPAWTEELRAFRPEKKETAKHGEKASRRNPDAHEKHGKAQKHKKNGKRRKTP